MLFFSFDKVLNGYVCCDKIVDNLFETHIVDDSGYEAFLNGKKCDIFPALSINGTSMFSESR